MKTKNHNFSTTPAGADQALSFAPACKAGDLRSLPIGQGRIGPGALRSRLRAPDRMSGNQDLKLLNHNKTSFNLSKKESLAQVSPIISVPLLNNAMDKYISKPSTVNFLVALDLQQKEIEKDTKKGYKLRSERTINLNKKIIQFIQDNKFKNLSFKEKLLSIKTNSGLFLKFNNNIISSTDNLEDGLKAQALINSKNLIMTKQNLIRNITPFDSELLYSKNIMYNFNKRNSYNLFKNEKNIYSILESAFLSMESLISKAIFSVKPKNILINLFFF